MSIQNKNEDTTLKIAIITKSLRIGYGIDEIVSIIARKLLEKDYKVTLFSTGKQFLLRDLKERVKIIPVFPLAFLNSYWQQNFFIDVRTMYRIVKSIKKYDLLMTCDPMHSIGWASKTRYKKPVISSFFGITPFKIRRSIEGKIDYLYQSLSWNSSFNFSDVIITNSYYTKNTLPEHLKKRAVVNYHGIDHLLSNSEEKSSFKKKLGLKGKKVILSIGRVSTPYKGTNDIIKMVQEISKKRRDVVLVLVGGKKETNKRESRRYKNVLALSNISYKMLKSCFSLCDIYCSASKWEGFNIPLVAAQANKKPVVAFNVGAHPEVTINEETGYLVNTEHEFKTQIEILLENKTVREEMGEKAGEFSKKFRWKNSIEKLERIFHKMDNLIKADHLSRKVSSKG